MDKIKLSVVIPAFNEEVNIKNGALNSVDEYLKSQNYSYEVIIVDDGSKDNTISQVEEFIKNKKNFSLIKNPHSGKAVTVMTGFLKAEGEVALFTDMDQATPISEVEKFFPKFDKGFDIVIGSRHGREGAPVIRKLMALVFSIFRSIVLGLTFSDTQCGFKAFNKSSREAIFYKMLQSWKKENIKGAAVNAGFDAESLFIAKKMGFKVAEVDVQWHHVGTERVQMINDSLDAVKDILRIKKDDLLGKFEKV